MFTTNIKVYITRTWEYKWPLAQTGQVPSPECAYFISVLPMKHFSFAHNIICPQSFILCVILTPLTECLCFTLYHFKGIVLFGPISINSCGWPFYLFYCHFTVDLVTECFGWFWYESSLLVYYT